jgi:hypothetical protein
MMAIKNDASVVGVGGRIRRRSKEHASIQMVRENVTMTISPIGEGSSEGTYDVVVEFIFTNKGPACTVEMGFPESGSGDLNQYGKKPAYTNYHSRVDGVEVPVKRVLAASSDEEQYEAFWVKKVKFAPKQTRKITVSYTAPFGGVAARGLNHTAHYDFTGGNWAGKVLESNLVVRFAGEKKTYAVARIAIKNEEGYVALTQKGRFFSKIWKDWQAEGHFTMYFGEMPPKNSAGKYEAYWGEVRPDRFLTLPGR